MKTTEFRIGNLLRDKVSKTLLEVIELTKDDIITHVIDRSKFPLKEGWELESIPLTDEWLIKFGFIQNQNEYSKDRFTVRLDQRVLIVEGYEYDYNGIILSIQDFKVHQLQNLIYALTNDELTFKDQ